MERNNWQNIYEHKKSNVAIVEVNGNTSMQN